MVTIKFERSHWEQHRVNLGAEHPDPVIAIPETGKLMPYPDDTTIFESAVLQREYLPSSFAYWEKEHAHLRPAIRGQVDRTPGGMWQRNELLLVWIEERGEWVVITYRAWMEGAAMEDHSYSGPFAPNDACLPLILKAYHKQLHRIVGTGMVGTMSPDKLMAKFSTLVFYLNEKEAKALAEELKALNWQPQSVDVELLWLLALNDEDMLTARVSDLESNIEECTHPSNRSFANHWVEDMAHERGPWWPDWAIDRALSILQRQNRNLSWYTGRR